MAVINVSVRIPEEIWYRVVQNAEEHRVDPDDVVYTAVDSSLN